MNSNQTAKEQPTGNQGNRTLILLCISLALIVVGKIGAYLVQTSGGRIQVVGLEFPTENGQWIAADLFRPQKATEKSPVPLVVACPVFERSKETMDGYSIAR